MSRLPGLAAAALVVVAAGLAVQGFRSHAWADVAGSVLYTVLVYVLVTAAAPGWRPRVVAVLTAAMCTAVEALQLTGLPAAAADAFPPSALVLGSGFAWQDLVTYLATAAVTGAVHARTRRGPGRDGGAQAPVAGRVR